MTNTSTRNATPDIATAVIIGGGIFGTSTAAHLTRLGVTVTLVNDGPLGGGASGRSLAWLNSARFRSKPYHDLRIAGIMRYRTLADQHPGADWLRFCGGLTWDAPGEGNDMARVYNHERDLGYPSIRLSAKEVSRRLPGLRASAIPEEGAIFNPNEGWVDLPSLCRLYAAEVEAGGGTIITDAGKASATVRNGRATGATTEDGRSLEADAVLLATGAAVPGTVKELGVKVDDGSPVAFLVETRPVDHPVQVILNTPRVALRRTLAGGFFMDSAWSEEAVVRHDDGTWSADPAMAQGLIDEARAVLDPAPDLEVAAIHMGMKPIPGDGDPVFGALPTVPGCFVAFSHSGATQGILTGEMLADEMAYGYRHPMYAPFRPERFAQ